MTFGPADVIRRPMNPLWMLLSVALASDDLPVEVPSIEEPAPEAPAAPPPTEVRLIYTAGAGGIGSGRYRFGLLDTLREEEETTIASAVAHHGAMAQGRWLLIASDHRVQTLADFLAGDEVTCDEPTPGFATRTRREVLLVEDTGGPLAGPFAASAFPTETRTCRAGGAEVRLTGPAGSGLPEHWSRFELRLGLTVAVSGGGVTQEGEIIGLPDEEATRRASLLLGLRERYPDALFVDGGSFVDGTSSVRNNALSLHRPIGFELLRRLDPAALVPGRTELAGGAKGLLNEGEGLPWVATNWATEDPALALPASRVVTVDGLDVAFLGVVDPDVLVWTPRLIDEGVSILPAAPAVQEEVDRLRASDDPPDLVVLLTEVGGPLLRELQQDVRNVDLILGDTAPEMDRVGAVDVDLRRPWAPDPAPAWTLAADGIGLAHLTFTDDGLQRLRLEPHRVTPELAPDLTVLERVNAVRMAEYPDHDRPLVPALADDPGRPLPHEVWEKVVCEAVLAQTGADFALLPALPAGTPIPGALTELLAVDRLAMLDVLEVHEVLGAAVPRMLDKAFEVVPVACGAPLGQKSPKIKGRAVEPDRLYTVVTTDRIRTESAVEGIIAEGRPGRVLDLPNRRVVTRDGEPVTLRRAVLAELRDFVHAEEDALAVLTARSPSDKPPQWTFRARPLSFSIERFQGAEDEAFAQVPETLATSPSSFTLSGMGDLQLEYSSRGIVWDARARAMLTKLRAGEQRSEPADDLKLSTSASLPGAALKLSNGFTPMPFAEVLYDTEFTPIENVEDGTLLPLQRDLSLTLGLSGSAGIFRTVRIGAFGLRDLSAIDKPTEYGARTEIYTRVGFGPGLFWTNLLDAYVWADTPQADASDLRFKALLDSRVELPLAWWLNMAFYGRAFVFQGRVPETDRVGASYTVGAALDLSGAFVF